MLSTGRGGGRGKRRRPRRKTRTTRTHARDLFARTKETDGKRGARRTIIQTTIPGVGGRARVGSFPGNTSETIKRRRGAGSGPRRHGRTPLTTTTTAHAAGLLRKKEPRSGPSAGRESVPRSVGERRAGHRARKPSKALAT